MKNRVSLYVPKLSELWYRQRLLADPETMSYNRGYDLPFEGYNRETGCIAFPETAWAAWHSRFVGQSGRFYAYVVRLEDGRFIGEANACQSEEGDWHNVGIVLEAENRGRGYATEVLRLLAREAFSVLGVSALRNRFESTRLAALRAHLSAGFEKIGEQDGFVTLELTRALYERRFRTPMTNEDMRETALRQSALESGCAPEDFLSDENRTVISRAHPAARRYLELPFECDLTTYGRGIVASAAPALAETARGYVDRFPSFHCFETPNLLVLSDALKPHGLNICFMAEYFLPDVTCLRPLDCPYEIRQLTPPDFGALYQPQWGNALCEKRKELDRLAMGAFDGDRLIGMAGASADCADMWQIGIDVLPSYRRRGVAACLTSRLALEVMNRGFVPFYCCAWSNVASARNAIRSGFRPAWVQLTARRESFVRQMLG